MVGDHVKISRHNYVFKVLLTKLGRRSLWFKKLCQILYHGDMLLKMLMVKIGSYYDKEMQKANQSEFRIEKLIK